MTSDANWLASLGVSDGNPSIDGLLWVQTYSQTGRPPDEVVVMEKAKAFGATAVFFEAASSGYSSRPQAFIYISDTPDDDPSFAELHRRLWSWGGVPLAYRRTRALVQLFRCAHEPDFLADDGQLVCKPFKLLQLGASMADVDPWWDARQLRNGTLWQDPTVLAELFEPSESAHRRLFAAIRQLYRKLNDEGVLRAHLRRRLLILSLLIAYLEERGVLAPDYFGQFQRGATKFFHVLGNGRSLIRLLEALEDRFNGNLFSLSDSDRAALRDHTQLQRFATLIEGQQDQHGQNTLWQLYSFRDLPIELISQVYQLFVDDSDSSVYTPPFLVRLMLDEALSWTRLDRLHEREEIVLDPSCGSGVFLVEAYKRLVIHWRSKNEWKHPTQAVLKRLLQRVHGVDQEEGAIELAAFSLCLALCDALEPEDIRASIKLFPVLEGTTLHSGCFFDVNSRRLIRQPVGVVIGNPPFKSSLSTEGAKQSYHTYRRRHGQLPDKQLAYLFLHESMGIIAEGGVLSMLQPCGLLYNEKSSEFRKRFFAKWNVREILDFVSVRGLFKKGDADPKVIVVVVEAASPSPERRVLHATFRRTARVEAEQGFDLDYYDCHWVPKKLAVENERVWRANLLGGGRVLGFVDRLGEMRTIESLCASRRWDSGEGFIEGISGQLQEAPHLVGKKLVPSKAITTSGIDSSLFVRVEAKRFKTPYTAARFTPPMLLVSKHMNLPIGLWTESYLAYKNEIVGICAPKEDRAQLEKLYHWIKTNHVALQAFVAATSGRLFTRKATVLTESDILSLPYPESSTLDLSDNERILSEDIVDFYRDLIRLGEESQAMKPCTKQEMLSYASIFVRQLNTVYSQTPIRALPVASWSGVYCQPFVFGNGYVDWSDTDELQTRIDRLLQEQRGASLCVTRIAKIYDGKFFFLLKPSRLRYWMRSVALRDADETLADLRAQGF
jgi:hypothetical protein